MELINLTEANKKDLANLPKYILKFSAEWCGACKLLAPIVKEVATTVNVPIYAVDVDLKETKDIVHQYGIKSIPQLVYVVGGKEADRTQGFMPKPKVLEFINSH